MGGLSSAVSSLSNVASVVGTVSSLANNVNALSGNLGRQQEKDLAAQQSLALAQLKSKQDADLNAQAASVALQKQQLAAQAQSDSDSRTLTLQRAVARQRAAFGEDGVSPADGSGQAVLLGLYDNAATDAADSGQITTLKNAALDQGLSDARSANMLELTQVRQKQNLQRQLLKQQDEIF